MGWKNWPYWMRGGVIGVIIGIIMLLFILLGLKFFWFKDEVLLYLFPLIFLILLGIGMSPIGLSQQEKIQFILLAFLNFVPYFILGALIGFIIGKFKSKNTQNIKTKRYK